LDLNKRLDKKSKSRLKQQYEINPYGGQTMKKENPAIARGTPVSTGKVVGTVKIVNSPAEVKKIQPGDIMVVSNSSPAYAIGVMNAAGLICERGGIMTHICIVAKELGIPCMAKVENATAALKENMIITLDATEGVIYE